MPTAKADMAGQLFVSQIEVPNTVKKLSDGPQVSFLNLPFDEALRYFSSHYGNREDALDLLAKYRDQASGTAKRTLEQIASRIYADIQSVLEGGAPGSPRSDVYESLDDWAEKFEAEPIERGYIDTVYRTNIQSAYGAGRVRQIESVGESFGFVQYRTAGDSSVRASHRPLDGKIWKFSDPTWKTFAPPNGFNCRCAIVLLDASEVDESSEEFTRSLRGLSPDEGFSGSPTNRT